MADDAMLPPLSQRMPETVDQAIITRPFICEHFAEAMS